MTIEQEVQNLVEAVDNLTEVVGFKKAQLDNAVDSVLGAQVDVQESLQNVVTSEGKTLEYKNAAETAKTDAESAKDKAAQWAENPEDVPVELGMFSAHHWANKASSSASSSLTNATNANTARIASEDARDAAQLSASSASSSATVASSQATIATEQAIEATTQASNALNSASDAADSATIAEAARDASMINGDVYPDEPTGRAAVNDGDYFKVVNSVDDYIYEYQRVDASSSTLITKYPTVNLFSVTPEEGKVPVGGAGGKLAPGWYMDVNDIGVAGQQGFGVGVCHTLPEGFSMMDGTTNPASDNYGNYLYQDGSVMVWIPAFYYRIGHVDNITYADYGVNSIDILPLKAFTDREDGLANGWALHRAFIDDGKVQKGFFIDKYRCSNNGGIASSIKNMPPLTFSADHNPITDINGVSSTALFNMFPAAKSRGELFFPQSRFMRSALALLSLAHGQMSTNNTFNAWYDVTNNFPKGCNNNALGDINDPEVSYVSDGFQNCGLTGSGTPFAKTTHNGQVSGVADLNGNVYTVESGITTIAITRSISNITLTNPPVITTTVDHGFTTGDIARITDVVGTTELNNRVYKITVVDNSSFSLDGVDATGFTAYDSAGSVSAGMLYTSKETTRFASYTGGNSSATDHWGEAGVLATMSPIPDAYNISYPDNGDSLRYGNGANQVIPPDIDGEGYTLAGLAFPSQGGVSTAGTSLYGADRFYQYVTNQMALLSGLDWGDGTGAGVFGLYSGGSRAGTRSAVGLSLAYYVED